MSNPFEELSKVDVGEFIEKKGQFSYLSWADAVSVLLKHYPRAEWEITKSPEGWPYVSTPSGCFVEVKLWIDEVPRTQVHPVLDHRNKAVKEPDSFQINTSIQRCLAKCISLHGLGLYIYRGEDLPEPPNFVSESAKMKGEVINHSHVDLCYEMLKEEIDADAEDRPDIDRMQAGFGRLNNSEQIVCLDKFEKTIPAGSKRMYRNVINDYLKQKPGDK